MRISDWSSDVCSSDLLDPPDLGTQGGHGSRWSGAESVRSRRLESPGKAALHTRLLIGSSRHPRPFTTRGSAIFVLCLFSITLGRESRQAAATFASTSFRLSSHPSARHPDRDP